MVDLEGPKREHVLLKDVKSGLTCIHMYSNPKVTNQQSQPKKNLLHFLFEPHNYLLDKIHMYSPTRSNHAHVQSQQSNCGRTSPLGISFGEGI